MNGYVLVCKPDGDPHMVVAVLKGDDKQAAQDAASKHSIDVMGSRPVVQPWTDALDHLWTTDLSGWLLYTLHEVELP